MSKSTVLKGLINLNLDVPVLDTLSVEEVGRQYRKMLQVLLCLRLTGCGVWGERVWCVCGARVIHVCCVWTCVTHTLKQNNGMHVLCGTNVHVCCVWTYMSVVCILCVCVCAFSVMLNVSMLYFSCVYT